MSNTPSASTSDVRVDVQKSDQPASKLSKAFLIDVAVSGLLAFLAIGALSLLHFGITDQSDHTLILGSFGASAVLLFGAPSLPFSQPRNCIGGHCLSCFVGVACYELLDKPNLHSPWLATPVSAALALMGMQLTGTVHPPAGGTVLIAVLGSNRLHDMGFALLLPTFIGSVLLVCVAMLNNLIYARKAKASYPTRWL